MEQAGARTSHDHKLITDDSRQITFDAHSELYVPVGTHEGHDVYETQTLGFENQRMDRCRKNLCSHVYIVRYATHTKPELGYFDCSNKCEEIEYSNKKVREFYCETHHVNIGGGGGFSGMS